MRLAILVILLTLSASASAQDAGLAQKIDVAIDRGVAWLKTQQDARGSWGPVRGERTYGGGSQPYTYPAGPTALSLLTLLKCGVKPDDPCIKKGFAFLRSRHRMPISNYEIIVEILAIEAKYNQFKRERKRERIISLGTKRGRALDLTVKVARKDRAWMGDLVSTLLSKQRDNSAWRYGWQCDDSPSLHGDKDMSHTTLATLALLAANRCKIKIPSKKVAGTLKWILDQQETEGPKHARHVPRGSAEEDYAPPMDEARGWRYLVGSPKSQEARATGGMTAGAIAGILACRKILERQRSRLLSRRLTARADKAVLDGLAWLDYHWSVRANPGGGRTRLLYLYSIERVGDLARINLIGRHHWYLEGARHLVAIQKPDGKWIANTLEPVGVLNTCFALLFLDRATLAVTGD